MFFQKFIRISKWHKIRESENFYGQNTGNEEIT